MTESAADRLHRSRELYRKTVKNPRTLDDFLGDRREEAAREDARFDRLANEGRASSMTSTAAAEGAPSRDPLSPK